MTDPSAAECVTSYRAWDFERNGKGRNTTLRLKSLPWGRIVVDAILLLSLLLASSSYLTVR